MYVPRKRRGMAGSVSGVQLNCSNPLTVDTLSEAKACWCLQFPALCSTATIQAAHGLVDPGSVYSPILPPPAHAAVDQGLSTTPAPYPCSDGSLATAATNCPAYSAAVDSVIADQQAAWQVQNAATMAETQANLDAIAAGVGSTNWALWIGLAVAGVFALGVVGGGSPRRYGR